MLLLEYNNVQNFSFWEPVAPRHFSFSAPCEFLWQRYEARLLLFEACEETEQSQQGHSLVSMFDDCQGRRKEASVEIGESES
jgi:hypothetical protein